MRLYHKTVASHRLLLILLLGGLGLGLLLLFVLLEGIDRQAVQADDGTVGILDEQVLLGLLRVLVGIQGADAVDNGADDTPAVAEVQIHLGGELARLVADHAKNDVRSGVAGVGARHETQLHAVGLGEDGLRGPAGQLAAVVLHLRGDDGTALRPQLAAPIEGVAGARRLAVELVEGLEHQLLLLAVDGVLQHGVDLGPDDHVQRLLVALQGQVEAAVLVALGGRGLGLLAGVVEGVGVVELDLGVLGLVNGLEGEVVVDEGRFHGQGAGGVDRLLLARGLGHLHGGVDGVLVDGDQVEGGALALVEVDLVALVGDDDVPRVHTARSTHEHGDDVGGGEHGRLVLLGELLDDGILRGGDVVGGPLGSLQAALTTLDGGLVVGAVVVVHETVRVEVLALGGLEVQLQQTGEIHFLQQVPLGANVDRRLARALRLVVVPPAEATTTVATTAAGAVVIEAVTLATATTNALEARAATALSTAALTATTEDGTTTAAERTLRGGTGVVDDGERRLVLGDLDVEKAGGTGTVHLLVAVVALVLLTTTSLTTLGIRGPVGHAAELVTLGERSVRDTTEHVVGRGRGAPSVVRREGADQVGNRGMRHGVWKIKGEGQRIDPRQ